MTAAQKKKAKAAAEARAAFEAQGLIPAASTEEDGEEEEQARRPVIAKKKKKGPAPKVEEVKVEVWVGGVNNFIVDWFWASKRRIRVNF